MRSHRSHLRSAATLAAVGALAVAGLVVSAPAAQALGAPGSPAANVRNSSTVVLSWAGVAAATSYDVQVDNNAGFASPEYSATTSNTRAVPTKALVPGDNHWRVRARSNSGNSAWVEGDFTAGPVTTPVPLSPSDGQHLAQPGQPPLLTWTGSQGATSYTVQVDADSDMVGAKSYTTKSTSLVVPDPLSVGDWFWTVTANKGNGLTSLPSDVTSFNIDPLDLPGITYPVDNINQKIEDVVLDWTPVPGATTYDLQVALDSGFNNIALDVQNVKGSRYSPPVTLNSDQFWWRVRAVDAGGQPTPWQPSVFGFQRQWPETPDTVYPTGSVGSPGALSTARQYYQWTPVPHATLYELYTAADQNFSVNVDRCRVVGTTYAPRGAGDCGYRSSGTTYWEVRPIDAPYPVAPGLPGNFSNVGAFNWTDPGAPSGVFDPSTPVTGLKIAVDGGGIVDGAQGCTAVLCDGVPATPVVSWDPVPGATSYRVYYAQDENFTTTELPNVPTTSNTMLALEFDGTTDNVSTLPESQAGQAYFWFVRPCGPDPAIGNAIDCGPSPVSQFPALPGAHTFRKASPAVTGLTSSDPSGSEITFSWDDYFASNQAITWNGEKANQTAKNYKIQVATDPSFGSIIDTRTVDQATYTAFDKLYPEGQLYWRVQALDAENNGLTWSDVHTFTKSSPPVALISPVGGAQVPGTTPFRWDAQAFAQSYTVEAYKNADHTHSAANRIFVATVKTTAYTPSSPIPASSSDYVWRVRRNDSSGNPGPWSVDGTFDSTGAAPSLLAPASGVWVSSKRGYFEWTEVPGAASYVVHLNGGSTTSSSTVATAYAPTSALKSGTYTWSVSALDSAGHELASSVSRTFRVDAIPPTVKSITPTTLKPTSVIKATFSEKVRGVSAKSVKLYKKKGARKVLIRTKVTLLKGKVAKVVPTRRLSAGDYILIFVASRITDVAGNHLAPSSAAKPLRTGSTQLARTVGRLG